MTHLSEPSREHPIHHLLRVMESLRGVDGCPWDRQQTHRSLLPYLIEEAYELIEAVEGESDESLRGELGDVLLQVVFHARIAEERGAFSFADIAATLARKLESRHPHVFSGKPVETAEEVSDIWHRQKMSEGTLAGHRSALEGATSGQPALQWAFQIGSRAARSGFEWRSLSEIEDKIAEELAEFRQASEKFRNPGNSGNSETIAEPAGGKSAKKNPKGTAEETSASGPSAGSEDATTARTARRKEMELEFGDLLFAMVQMSRWQGIDPEAALRAATRKFIARFQWMEESLRERGLQAEQQTSRQWWAMWREAKSQQQ